MEKAYKNVKYIKIAEQLIHELKTGAMEDEKHFLTREEIARRFQVASLTGYKIIKYIESQGLISCGRGRRASILHENMEKASARNIEKQRIGIITPFYEEQAPSAVLRWIVAELQHRFVEDGHVFNTLNAKDAASEKLESYTGMILIETIDKMRSFADTLKEQQMPFSAISFYHLEANTVHVVPRFFLIQVGLFFMRHNVTKVIVFSGVNHNVEKYIIDNQPVIDSYFHSHGYGADIFRTPALDATQPDTLDYIRKILEENKSEKLGVITRNMALAEMVGAVFREQGKLPHRDYVMATYDITPDMKSPIPYVDFKSEEIAGSLKNILYNQFRTNTCYDPGAILVPHFVEV